MVRIYLCTYNGEKYLEAQLHSIAAQTYKNLDILISDDCSRDGTINIINQFKSQTDHKVSIMQGPQIGAAANFLYALKNDRNDYEYYAFSDQDDVWEKQKIERAVEWLRSIPQDIPALYGARVSIVDHSLTAMGVSDLPRKPLTFSNALVENFTSGNTMVFNRKAFEILQATLSLIDLKSVPVHDWWAYLIVSGVDGKIHCDDYISLDYRQHGNNVIGIKRGINSLIHRSMRLLKNNSKKSIDRNIVEIIKIKNILNNENKEILSNFIKYKHSNLFSRIKYLLKINKLYRQKKSGQLGFFVGFILNKI